MTGRRRVAIVLMTLLAACEERAKEPEPPPTVAPAPPTTPSRPADNVAAPRDSPPDLRGLSPSQRRAYERGFADCRAGRYEPDNFPEAYRIGCAAAQE